MRCTEDTIVCTSMRLTILWWSEPLFGWKKICIQKHLKTNWFNTTRYIMASCKTTVKFTHNIISTFQITKTIWLVIELKKKLTSTIILVQRFSINCTHDTDIVSCFQPWFLFSIQNLQKFWEIVLYLHQG